MEIYKYLISNYSFPNVVNDIYLLAEILDEQDKWRIDALSFNIYRKEIKKIKFLNYAEEQELFVRIQDGDKEAEKKLILANLGFVIHVARKYQNQGLSLNDLISEGYFGLMRAAQTAENRGIRFQSYAYQHIRNSIKQAIIKYGNAICYPDNILAEVNKINKFVSKFHLEYGCLPSLEQISEHIKIPIDSKPPIKSPLPNIFFRSIFAQKRLCEK